MNKDIIKGQWQQMKGNMKTWWGKLTDDDIEKIDGNYDVLVGKIQERYGRSREEAEKECAEKCGCK